MKITIEPTQDQTGRTVEATHCTVTVAHPFDDLDISEAFCLVKQALIAWGFSETTVDSVLGEE